MYRTPGDIAGCTELNMIAAQEHSGKKKKGSNFIRTCDTVGRKAGARKILVRVPDRQKLKS